MNNPFKHTETLLDRWRDIQIERENEPPDYQPPDNLRCPGCGALALQLVWMFGKYYECANCKRRY